MFQFHTDTVRAFKPSVRVPSELRLTVLSGDDHVITRARQAATILGGSIVDEVDCLADIRQGGARSDVYILDPRMLDNPVKDAPYLLDDRRKCVVLYGAAAGLVATRSAVRRVIDVDMGPEVLATILRKVKTDTASLQEPPKLSLRERETLRLYGRGMTLKVIGHRLGISAKSAETYKTRACQKLGLSDRAAVLTFIEPSLNQL
jgi:DNA-binding CsgD family transcriptional regulator